MIDKNKQYRTRDGREVRIYATDGMEGGNPAVHGAFKSSWGWLARTWRLNGEILGVEANFGSDLDLIEVKPRIKRKVWVNVYPHRMGVPHGNHAYVAMHRGKDAIACVEIDIDVEEGHGLR